MKLIPDKILFEHGVEPLLLTAFNCDGVYLCCAILEDGFTDPFLCIKVGKKTIKGVIEGKLDIGMVYKKSRRYYLWEYNGEIKEVTLKKEWLPGEDFYLCY